MATVRWESYPHAATATPVRSWLQLQMNLQLAPKTIDAYARSLEDYLLFCSRRGVPCETASREDVAAYVHDLAVRPHPHASRLHHLPSGTGLSNATMQLRLTAVRLFYDYLMERQIRADNPVGRGRYTPGKAFGGTRERGIIPHFRRLPWVPNDDQWQAILRTLGAETARNRAMVLLAYDGALRREELLLLETGDIDPAYRQLTIRAETTKNRNGRVVFYSEYTARELGAYLRHRRTLSTARGPVFLSESRRNSGQPLSPGMWNKVVQGIAVRADVVQLHTHTFRHVRLTHMARAGLDIHRIAVYAGHRSTETTLLYLHLSGRDLADSVTRGMAEIDRWLAATVGGPQS